MDSINYIKFIIAFVFVISVMILLGMAARRFGLGTPSPRRFGQKKRLQILDVLPLDAKRRVFLIARDDQEHLILTGNENACIIEKNIPRKDQPEDDTEKSK